jgi:hypothetical protein
MALVSDITDTPLPELAELNPAILKGVAPADYAVHVPKGTGTQLTAGLEMIPPEHRDAWRMHRLGIGETVADVSKRFGVAASALIAANNLQSHEPSDGDRLLIPAVVRPAPVAASRTARTGARRGSASVSTAKGKAPAPQTGSRPKARTAPKTPVVAASTKPRTSN